MDSISFVSAKNLIATYGSDLDSLLSLNPRKGNPRSRIGKQIAESLALYPNEMHLFSKGITIVHYKGKPYIVDGGTTYQVLLTNVESLGNVRVPVIETTVKSLDQILRISQAKNAGNAVRARDTANLAGMFSRIADAVKGTRFETTIQYKTGYKAQFPVVDILRIMHAAQGNSDKQLSAAYKYSENSLLLAYKEGQYDKTVSALPDLLAFYEEILATFTEQGITPSRPLVLACFVGYNARARKAWVLKGNLVVKKLARAMEKALDNGHTISTFGQAGAAYKVVA
jgi:hypothetical protein